MKKIIIPKKEIEEIIQLYTIGMVGTPSLSKRFGYHKSVINRTLKENGVTLDTPGRRFLGGKGVSDKKYYETNKETILENHKKWSKENREHLKEYHKQWREGNIDYQKYRRNYEKTKKDNDPQYKLSCYTRTAVYTCLKERNIVKYSKTFNLLPYNLDELMEHLESQFTEGMTWDNYGDWHVDHIKPMSSFDFTEYGEFELCWSLRNLQPLWAGENLSKGSR